MTYAIVFPRQLEGVGNEQHGYSGELSLVWLERCGLHSKVWWRLDTTGRLTIVATPHLTNGTRVRPLDLPKVEVYSISRPLQADGFGDLEASFQLLPPDIPDVAVLPPPADVDLKCNEVFDPAMCV